MPAPAISLQSAMRAVQAQTRSARKAGKGLGVKSSSKRPSTSADVSADKRRDKESKDEERREGKRAKRLTRSSSLGSPSKSDERGIVKRSNMAKKKRQDPPEKRPRTTSSKSKAASSSVKRKEVRKEARSQALEFEDGERDDEDEETELVDEPLLEGSSDEDDSRQPRQRDKQQKSVSIADGSEEQAIRPKEMKKLKSSARISQDQLKRLLKIRKGLQQQQREGVLTASEVEEIYQEKKQRLLQQPQPLDLSVNAPAASTSSSAKDPIPSASTDDSTRPADPPLPAALRDTGFDPFGSEVDMDDVGVKKNNAKTVYGAIRINSSLLLSISWIPIGTSGKDGFDGWALTNVKEGEDHHFKKDARGEKRKPFQFSGGIESLAELHLALRRLRDSMFTMPEPNLEELAKVDLSARNSELNLIPYHTRGYEKDKVTGFREFRLLIEDSQFTKNRQLFSWRVVHLFKKKSEYAFKAAQALSGVKASKYFHQHVPIKDFDALIQACAIHLIRNNRRQLPMHDDGSDDDREAPLPVDTEVVRSRLEKQRKRSKNRYKAVQQYNEQLAVGRDKGEGGLRDMMRDMDYLYEGDGTDGKEDEEPLYDSEDSEADDRSSRRRRSRAAAGREDDRSDDEELADDDDDAYESVEELSDSASEVDSADDVEMAEED